ncbi:MAG: hypothetical protein WAV67_01685 [Dokdonella sp.]
MAQYKNPPKTARTGATTNINNSGRIREIIATGCVVEIFALFDDKPQQYRGFEVNLAAGLEDGVIAQLLPSWNFRPDHRPTNSKDSECTAVSTRIVRPAHLIPDVVRKYSSEPRTADYERLLSEDIHAAHESMLPYLEVRSGDLHRKAGGKKSYTTCCGAMRKLMVDGDVVLAQPPMGNGGNLYIRYAIPRPIYFVSLQQGVGHA